MEVSPLGDANITPAIKARREYYRQWRKKNPEKVKASQLRYWERKAQEGKQVDKCDE